MKLVHVVLAGVLLVSGSSGALSEDSGGFFQKLISGDFSGSGDRNDRRVERNNRNGETRSASYNDDHGRRDDGNDDNGRDDDNGRSDDNGRDDDNGRGDDNGRDDDNGRGDDHGSDDDNGRDHDKDDD